MNFSTLQGLTIPEGVVTQIAKDGVVLWSGTKLIEFSIYGVTYQAEDGMTWGEWVNSKYNTDGYKIGSSNYIYTSNDSFYVTAGGYGTPKNTTLIVANRSYGRDKA